MGFLSPQSSVLSPYFLILYGICALLLAGCRGDNADRSETASQSTASTSTYKPTSPHPQEVGTGLVGPSVYTVDARSREIWMYFDFSRGAVVAVLNPKADDWDLAFRRHTIRSNGGATNPAGQAALSSLGERDFTTVLRVPDEVDFVPDARTTKRPFPYNPVVHKWYNYSYTSNVLVPKPMIYLIRTQDGKYAKMRLLSYYCDGNVSGCMTFEYVYQGDGSTLLAPPAARLSHHTR